MYAIAGTPPVTGKPEKNFYIVYRKGRERIEEKAGRQSKDAMTAARAAALRGVRIKGSPTHAEQRAKRNADRIRMTISRLCGACREHPVRRKGLAADRVRFGLHIRPALGDKVT